MTRGEGKVLTLKENLASCPCGRHRIARLLYSQNAERVKSSRLRSRSHEESRMTTVRAFQCPRCISFDLVGDFTDRFINQIEFARRAAIRRHDVDRVAQRPNQ